MSTSLGSAPPGAGPSYPPSQNPGPSIAPYAQSSPVSHPAGPPLNASSGSQVRKRAAAGGVTTPADAASFAPAGAAELVIAGRAGGQHGRLRVDADPRRHAGVTHLGQAQLVGRTFAARMRRAQHRARAGTVAGGDVEHGRTRAPRAIGAGVGSPRRTGCLVVEPARLGACASVAHQTPCAHGAVDGLDGGTRIACLADAGRASIDAEAGLVGEGQTRARRVGTCRTGIEPRRDVIARAVVEHSVAAVAGQAHPVRGPEPGAPEVYHRGKHQAICSLDTATAPRPVATAAEPGVVEPRSARPGTEFIAVRDTCRWCVAPT